MGRVHREGVLGGKPGDLLGGSLEREVELIEVRRRAEPLSPAGWTGLVAPKLFFPLAVGDRALLSWLDIYPVKHFEVREKKVWFVTTGIEGNLRVCIYNPTPFQRDCEFRCRAVGRGFKFVDTTFPFTIRRRCKNLVDYHWSIGFFDYLVRAFLSLFSSETRISGYVKVGGLKKDFDTTDEIPIEHG